MKAFFTVLVFVLLSAYFASANGNTNGYCPATPFNLTHYLPQIIVPGSYNLYAGYQVSISGRTSSSSQVTIQGASVVFTASCSKGGSATFTYQLPDETFTIPANSGSSYSWNPSDLYLSGFQSGPITTTSVCGAGKSYAITSATLSGGLVSSQTKAVQIRFTYFSFVDLSKYQPSPQPSPKAGKANPSPPQHQHFDTNDIKVWFGDSAYCNPKSVTPKACLSSSRAASVAPSKPVAPSNSRLASVSGSNTASQTAQPTPSNSASATASSTATGSDTASQTAQPTQSTSETASATRSQATHSISPSHRIVPRTTILGSARRYLRRA